MALRIYVSRVEASYFVNNTLSSAPNPPTIGKHNVGDIVISSNQQNGIFGWVCIEAGEPGKWDVICDIVDVKNDINNNRSNINELIERITNDELKIVNIEQAIDVLENRVEVNENNIVNLDNRVNINANNISKANGDIKALSKVVDDNANSGTETTDNLQEEINKLKEFVGSDIVEGDDPEQKPVGLRQELSDLKDLVDINVDKFNKVDAGLQKEIDDLEKLVDNNKKASDKTDDELKQEIEDLKDIVGTNADDASQAATGLQKEINDLKEIVGTNADDASQAATGLQKEINDLKDFVGLGEDDASQADTGLQKEINDLKNFVGLGENAEEGGGNLLDQVEQNQDRITALEEKTSDTVCSTDINSKDIVSSGELVDDSEASHGKCYRVESDASNKLLYSATVNDIKFGQYGICLRMKCTQPRGVSSAAVRVKVINGANEIFNKQYFPEDFGESYTLLYGAFEYNAVDGVKNRLKIQVEVLSNIGLSVSFDYAYISMIIPSVFL
jgi:uncharacterized protein YlxW (UPF0749 family)